MNLSIVIPCKADEPRLMQTLGAIAGTAPRAEVVAVFDGCAVPENLPENITAVMLNRVRGTQYARHAGIMAASGEQIFTCDAHMDFQPGWALKLAFHLRDNPDSVCCFKMCAMEQDHLSWMDARAVKKGAAMNWTVKEGDYRGALVGKWADNQPGEISCIMGACYGFKRQRYLDINQPWRLGTGWGCDEETISAVNWLCGGSIDLLDHYVGHYMGTARPLTVREGDQLWANRLRLLWMLPLNDFRGELAQWLVGNSTFGARLSKVNDIADLDEATGFEIHTPYTRTIEDWIEHFELKPKKEVHHA